MILKNVYLKNYGAIKEAEIEFQKGWNLISGANGNGKSHIIRAIAYLLLNKTFGKVEDDCNWDSNNFLVSLEALYQNITFDIQAMFSRKNGVSKECKIGSDVYTMNSEVTKALANYFDPTLCSASILSFQGQMDIVTAKDAERRDILKKIYDLSFSTEIKSLEDEKSQIQNKVDQLEKEKYNLENTEYNFSDLKSFPFDELQYKDYQVNLKEIENKIIKGNQALSDYEDLKLEVEKRKKSKEAIERDKLTLQNKIEDISESIDIAEIELKKLNTNELLDQKNKELEEAQDNTIIDKLQEEYKSLVPKRVPKFDEVNLENKKKESWNLQSEIKNLEEKLDLINQGKCPTCGHEFESAEKEDVENEINEKSELLEKIDEEIGFLEKEKEQYEEEKEKQEQIKNRRETILKEIESKENINEQKITSLKVQIESIKSKKESIYKEKLNLKNFFHDYMEQKENLESKIKEIEEELKEKNKKLQELPDVNLDKFEKEREEIQENLKAYDSIVTENKVIEENNKILQKQKEANEERLKELNKDLEKDIKEINQYEEAINIYKKDLPKYIISFLLEDLKYGMNDLLSEAYGGKYTVDVKETRSGLKILYGAKQKEISLSSGAEQNLFNLGFKNAFAYLSGLQILFLDESMNFADDNIAKETFNHLNNKLEKGELEQIFVITHKKLIKELLEGDFGAKVFIVEDGKVNEEVV